jgi:hypothetical protein
MARTLDRPLYIPIGGIESGEIFLEGRFELTDSVIWVRIDELFREENDNTSDSGGD